MAEPTDRLDPEVELDRDVAALIGRTLGEFVIREPLSGGGFGLVFFAEQKALGREAVIKVLRQALQVDPTIVQRFLREARLATLLDHPFAAHTYGFGAEPDGLLWIAMELVRGTPLDALLQLQGPIALERFAPLLERICQVVQTAHERGIVHRDLKPANVMVLSRAGQLLPKLLDFGIARLIGEAEPEPAPSPVPVVTPISDSSHRLTGAHIAMGSPHYMAPEQWLDASAADSRSDIYSLGVICYQALTGRLPFRASTRDQLAAMHARAPVPPLGTGFPAALDEVLARAMAKRPRDRYPTALELAAAFQAASGTAGQGAPLPRLDPALRDAAVAGAPQPLARAIAALESARNPHQARDALWQLARVVVRLMAGIALAAHRHVVLTATDPLLGEKLRLLRGRAPTDELWLDVARALVRPFAELRDAHPVPELVSHLLGDGSRSLDELLALRASAEAAAGGEQQVRELFTRGLALAAESIRALDFLFDYPLVVAGRPDDRHAATLVLRPGGGGAPAAQASGDLWMGGQGGARPRLPVSGPVGPGHAALVDKDGVVVVSLWPFIQAEEPSPGAGLALFFLDGRGRRGARMVALPDPFEIEDEEAWDLLGELLDESAVSGAAAAADESCPYPGLSAFTAADAAAFFGRERETEAFVNRLRVQPLMAVVGPSGAGKSSFIQAGVIPALPAGWTAVVVRPGPSPLASLSARLATIGIDAGSLRARLAGDPDALAGLLAGRGEAGTLVLVIDQVEELFTVCDDPDERALYAAGLARAARAADDPVRVVMTLRDDFLVRAEALPAWRTRLGQGMQILTTPDEPDLRRILTEPLRRIGYELDAELPDEMVREVAGEPAALALLSFTASRLWELRDRRFRQIGRKAYRSLGGVGGALAQHAEETLAAMPSEEQRLVREVFRHAVTAEGTRAILSPDELAAALGGGAHADAVVEKLVAARLLVVSDAELGERIEVAHEALLEAWPRLVIWRQEDAAGARLRDLLRSAARQWDERDRPSGLLWRGDALAEYRIWRGRHPGALMPAEESFAAASLAEATRVRRIRRFLVGGAFVVLAAVAVALVIFGARADRQRSRAVASERAAQRSADKLELQLRSQYEGQGRRLVVADDPLKGLAFLAEAGKLGAGGPAHDFVVGEAIRATDGELFTVRHENMIGRVRFSPDGSLLLTTGYDNEARLWDAVSGAQVARLEHDAPVVRAAFSPGGELIATGTGQAGPAETGAVRLWSAAGTPGPRIATRGAVQAIEFSPDGTRLAVASAADEVALWDPASGALVVRLSVAADLAESPFGSPLAFSPDGARVAAGDRAGAIHVWEVRSARELAVLRGHHKRVQTVRFASNGARLVSASQDGSAMVWSTATWRRELTLRHADQVTSASFSADGRRILTASADRSAIVWDADTGRSLQTLSGHLAAVTQAAFSPDGARIATVSEDATAILWDAATGERLARRLGHSGPIKDVAFSPDGTRMATASLDFTATVWSTEPTRRVARLSGHEGPVPAADLAPDGAHAATGGTDGMLRVWDVVTGRELFHLRAHDQLILDLRFSPSGDRLATASADHRVKVWSARDGALLATMKHDDWANSVSWSPDGTRLASAGEDGAVRIWSAGSGEALRSLRAHDGAPVAVAAFSPSGELLVTTGDDSSTRLYDPASGRQLARFDHADARYSLVFDPSGEQVVSVTSKSVASIWRVRDGEVATELVGHVGAIRGVAWSRQGLIATASADRTARIWDPATGEELAVITHPAEVMRAALDASGRYLLTTGVDGSAAIWEFSRWGGDRLALDHLLRCRVPFQIEKERVTARPRDSSSCPSSAAQ